jgi:hypothetical protein
LGGAGKTAVAARFLQELLGSGAAPQPDGLFVWSFYQEPDAGLCLQEAYRYFARGDALAVPARGAGLLHLLNETLAVGGPHLLVLDGLEKVQRPESTSTGLYGQLEDPLLKGLLTRLVEGIGRTVVVVTSRFPLTDLEPFRGRGYRDLDIGGLGLPAALALLRSRGVHGDDAVLGKLIDAYGAHALTLDHLGGLIGQFLGGDPQRAPDVATLSTPGTDRQALRLARLLRGYEDHLPAPELALLGRLCLLRRSVSEEQILQLFLCSPPVHARTVRELGDMVLQTPESSKDEQAKMADLTAAIRSVLEEALCTAPIAGPEENFQHDIRLAARTVLDHRDQGIETDLAELAHLYAEAALDAPTDQRPLSAEDRDRFRALYDRYTRLREHPLMPFQKPDPQLSLAFKELGWGQARRGADPDLGPSDLLEGLKKVYPQLVYVTLKHGTLRRVRELCHFYQRKWELAGPLAPLDAAGLRQILHDLVGRHLIQREADGSFSVHPAVRDHFYRLATAAGAEAWHELIRQHLVSLARQPGRRKPEDQPTLDLVEEAIHHALGAGRPEEALGLYHDVLGGLRHLAWKLGETTRGLRILRGFNPCPDRWALGWFLRALGELEAAYAENDLPFFRADIRLLQGRLPEVAAENDPVRTALAAFLMGQTTTLPSQPLSCPVPRDQLLLYLGRLSQIRQSTLLERFYHDIGWEGDRARCQLILAEVARRQGNAVLGRKHLDEAAAWILRAGSVEHLCLLHLTHARAARTARKVEEARRAVGEGLHLARHGGLGLYHVELLCEAGESFLALGDLGAAEAPAREALERASAEACRFLWGAAEAGHLLGRILAAGQRCREARAVLEQTLPLCRRLGDPRAAEVEDLQESLAVI